ncbi:glycosyltransferase family 39 protein [Frankia sp. R82]|uniref:ArnT family glycosyltransferase n=1 Tax=Frankia sp. R82 TaxID=2950553 RepID=UPI002043C1FA|nr:glycosyltransferase family 39 protein [Frankia sp. R82]MCM3886679.1 glycosyltransferase family 39 protein [Frankia sp. R82]
MTQPPEPSGPTGSSPASTADGSVPTSRPGPAVPVVPAQAAPATPPVTSEPPTTEPPTTEPAANEPAPSPSAPAVDAGAVPWRRWVSGSADDPVWARPALVALLAATALLYLWDLGATGNGNSFYAAAVQSGTKSWKALLFGALDPGTFITVDKPPASLWAMALSGRIFGFSSWSMLVPSALGGVVAVGLMYAMVRRWFGPAAGLLAGVVLALTPVAALMFRFNNPDGVLTFVLVLAAYCLVRALDRASTGWLAAAGAALGLAFLTKMLQGFIVLPAFVLAYLVAAPTGLWRRVWQLLVGGAAVVVAAGWWVATVELWPKDSRPYVGGSTDNSVLNLTFGYNGLGRVFGGSGNGGGGGRGGRGGGGAFGGQQAGWLRLFGDQIGGQVSWLVPGSLVLLLGGLWVTRRAPLTDRSRAALLFWGAWTLITSITLSLAQGTFHPYYTASIAPGIAGLVASGTAIAWRERQVVLPRAALAAAVVVSGLWAFVLLNRTSSWYPWLRVVVLVAAVVAGVALFARRALAGRGALAVAVAGVVAVLGGPAAYTAATVTTAQSGGNPTAGPSGQGGQGGFRGAFAGAGQAARLRTTRTVAGRVGTTGTTGRFAGIGGTAGAGGGFGRGGGFGGGGAASAQLTTLLKNGSQGYRWAAAVSGSSEAATLELASNTSVMAMGGFGGRDPAPTLTQFEQDVRTRQVHYFLGGGTGTGGMGPGTASARGGQGTVRPAPGNVGGTTAGQPGAGFGQQGRAGRRGGSTTAITSWVQQHYTPITVDSQTIYDLTRPISAQPAGDQTT